MTEPRPVLVIHGVGNRGQEAGFRKTVADLGAQHQPHLRLIPVYWGEFAAEPAHITATLPTMERAVRGELDRADGFNLALALLQDGDAVAGTAVRGTDQGWEVVAAAATQEQQVRGAAVRGDDIRDAIRAEWSRLEYLPRIADEEVLAEVGRLIGDAVAEGAPPASADPETGPGEFAVRGVPGSSLVRVMLGRADALVARVLGEAGGRLNQFLRARLAPQFAGFFGDILAYLNRRTDIQDHIRARIAAEVGDAGTAERPIGAIAHSLGGVILFDMAVSKDDPLHLDGFVTFGSQAPFFHAMSRRSPKIAEFSGEPVALPPTIRGQWVNLWQPLDPLAFVAAPVFKLHDDTSPDDIPVPHDEDTPLWTHSVYWKKAALRSAIDRVFPGSGH